MAKDSILSSVGDVLVINVKPKVNGKVHLTDYIDTLVGVTSTRTIDRQFRITTDEIFYNEWETLTSDNLAKYYEVVTYEYLIQVKYTRTGTDLTGNIEFIKIDFMGSFELIEFIAPTINSSIFAKLINNNEIDLVERNLFKKLYFRGILPKYIERGDDIDKVEDADFISLFSSVAKYFSMFLHFFKRYEKFNSDLELMKNHIRQEGLFFDESDVKLADLQYLSSHLYDEIRKRGTNMIFKRLGETISSGDVVPIDGEFIRLLRVKKHDEMLFELIAPDNMGWCLGKSSPMWKGTNKSNRLNKTKEVTEDFQNLDNFYHFVNSPANMQLVTIDNKQAALLEVTSVGECGFGRFDGYDVITDNDLINVESSIDYEITFSFKAVYFGLGVKILFGVEGFDILKNKLYDSFSLPNGNSVSEIFVNEELSVFRRDVWYNVRGIIHAYSTQNSPNYPTNIGFGNNLHFNNRFVKFILPKIQVSGAGVGAINVWNYKIRPLVRGNNVMPLKNNSVNSNSLGFLQCPSLFHSYVKNNNNNLSNEEITEKIDKYLLPFNVLSLITYANKY